MFIFIVFGLLFNVLTLDNGVGLTPPMGWNSWNHFGCSISEDIVKKTADLLVSTGLAAKGYKYVNLDDCWSSSRNSQSGQIVPDAKFPNGMNLLSDYIHHKGLWLGILGDSGFKTCAGRPGSLGYETIDAQTFAKWGVDYIKYDNCNTDGISAKLRYPVMRDALNKTGRKIFFSLGHSNGENISSWGMPVGNSWRTGDISDNWASVMNILDQQIGLQQYSGIGGWNDPDMLQVGNGGMTNDQYQSHFALWAALKAPLLIGCDLSQISQTTLNILGNQQIIAINQDPLGIQASLVRRQGLHDYWSGPLSDNRRVMVLLNRDSKEANFEFSISKDLKYGTTIHMRDAINHVDLGQYKDDNVAINNIASHSVAVLVIKPIQTLSIQ